MSVHNSLSCTNYWVLSQTPHIQAGYKYFSGSISVTSSHPRTSWEVDGVETNQCSSEMNCCREIGITADEV
ncbi:hypothetical protein DPEC_G00219420 [Dallia pectoralis]|uniref:Uncharacterized protein n=1 Tax=Dallia pectoralis TaxID=75939 RepID=A0ACC2G3T9_DALPE|nr:hypothetical protein DPEC_G00219420 [Dallia pectoralis]